MSKASATQVPAGNTALSKEPEKANAFNAETAWAHLKKQVAFGPRVPNTAAHLACRDWILETLKPHVDATRLQSFSYRWNFRGQSLNLHNIIGEQNWKDAKVRVLLVAHWDTCPFADQEQSDERAIRPILGANDGASGVAVLLELARVLKSAPKDLGIMYLFTDGEDIGPELEEMFIGAKHFAKNLPSPKPNYGILLDMIGDKSLTVPMEPNSMNIAPNLMKALYSHASKIGLEKQFPRVTGPAILDDHLSISEAGVPTIDLIDFSYPYWHTLDDTVDKCSKESLGAVGKLMESWLKQEPVWNEKP